MNTLSKLCILRQEIITLFSKEIFRSFQTLHEIHNPTHTFTPLKCYYPDQRHCFTTPSVTFFITQFLTKLWNKILHKTACLSWVSKPGWISSLVCFMACTLWNSDVTPINHLSADAIITGDLFFHLLCQIEVLSQE